MQLAALNDGRYYRGHPGGASIPLGGVTDPYRFLVHTGPLLPWVHPVTPLPVPTSMRGCTSGEKQGPGLRALFPAAAMLSSRTTSPSRLLYVRSISPGHQDRLQAIRGKCWIASRSLWTGPGQAQGAWPGGLGPPRRAPGAGFWPVLARFRAIWDPDPGHLGPDPGHPGQPAGQDPGNSGQFCQKCSLGPPEYPGMAGTGQDGQFWALSRTDHPGIRAARAELKSSILTAGRKLKTRILDGFHSI